MLIAIGAGLLYTMKLDAGSAQYLGYQFIIGIGNGICQQIPLTVVQATTKPEDLAASMSTVLCKYFNTKSTTNSCLKKVEANHPLKLYSISLPTGFRSIVYCSCPIRIPQPSYRQRCH